LETTYEKAAFDFLSALALSAGAALADSAADQATAISTQYNGISAAAAGTPAASAPLWNGNYSSIDQIGGNNNVGTSTTWGVDQQSLAATSANSSVINQGKADYASYNASASVTQQSKGSGQASSLINQDSGFGATGGYGNSASVTQIVGGDSYNVSYSTVNQSGAALVAVVNQGVSGTPVSNVTSYIGQSGQNGSVNVNQQASGGSSVVLQTGTGNVAAVGVLPAIPNVSVSQTSTGSDTSTVSQNSTTLGIVGVTQSGSATNISHVDQTGAATANIYQLGASNNTSGVGQTGTGSATVYQNGSTGNNLSAINQTGSGSVNVNQGYSADNTALAIASNNYSGVNQTGSGTINVWQSGSANLTNASTVTQDLNSTAQVWQQASAANNSSAITQTWGANNLVNVHQH